jgi:undecaprenyl diphosphate synthase
MTNTIFNQTDSQLKTSPIPKHVAIIMDGNRRWAKKNDLPIILGHRHGAQTLERVVEDAANMGIQTLTVFAFSTENWLRPYKEVGDFMQFLRFYLKNKKKELVANNVHLDTIGNLNGLPNNLQKLFLETKVATAHCNGINLVIAINYGARDNIKCAVQAIVEDCQRGTIQKEKITEDLIGQYLDTAPWGYPDLLIRTSGETRLSNFLLWELSYTEIHIINTLWPDFSRQEFIEAITIFQQKQKRIGC